MDENLENFFAQASNIEAKDIPLRRVPSISSDKCCRELFSSFFDLNVKVMIVFDDKERYQGILTEYEFLVLFTPRHSDIHDTFSRAHLFTHTSAGDLANTRLPKVKDDDTVKKIAELMTKYETSILPRIDKKGAEVKGIIMLRDIIQHVKQIWTSYDFSDSKFVESCEG